jgi:hypothetical protein
MLATSVGLGGKLICNSVGGFGSIGPSVSGIGCVAHAPRMFFKIYSLDKALSPGRRFAISVSDIQSANFSQL